MRIDEEFGDAVLSFVRERYPEERKSVAIEKLASELGCSVVYVWQMVKGRVPGIRLSQGLESLGFRF
jgi:hypothetical protein